MLKRVENLDPFLKELGIFKYFYRILKKKIKIYFNRITF